MNTNDTFFLDCGCKLFKMWHKSSLIHTAPKMLVDTVDRNLLTSGVQ